MTKPSFYENAKNNEILPIGETWEFFAASLQLLGMPFVLRAYGPRKQRQFYKWSADPGFCEETARNPLDRIKMMLKGLMLRGELGRSVAVQAVGMLADVVGCELIKAEAVEPDQETLEGECLDDYPALADLHAAIRSGRPMAVVRSYCQTAKLELDETLARYGQEIE